MAEYGWHTTLEGLHTSVRDLRCLHCPEGDTAATLYSALPDGRLTSRRTYLAVRGPDFMHLLQAADGQWQVAYIDKCPHRDIVAWILPLSTDELPTANHMVEAMLRLQGVTIE